MNLSEKIKHLREVEGELRGLNRPMTQMEVVKAMQEEQHESISQAYLSQLEKGKRVHLTATSRDLLANFFKVHPSYLVSDPPDYSIDLLSDMEDGEDGARRFERWLVTSAAEWHTDPEIYAFLRHLGTVEHPRQYLVVFEHLLHQPVKELEQSVQVHTPHQENGAR